MTDEPADSSVEDSASPLKSIKFWAGCILSLAAVSALGWWAWNVFQTVPPGTGDSGAGSTPRQALSATSASTLPAPIAPLFVFDIQRSIDAHTLIPSRGPAWITSYTVKRGDTIDSIANSHDLKPDSILWGNEELLVDSPNLLKPGMVLNILPVDGAYYKWKEGDTLNQVALDYNVSPENIIDWPANSINPLDPVIQANTMIIIPGGYRPFQWESIPLPVFNGKSRSINEGGATCPNGYNGTPGLGDWIWPTHGNHSLSGWSFIPGQHAGIDIAIYFGEPIYAADAGVVVYAGWSDFGYGELVVIDHMNGWHTFYAHLSQWNVTCGQQVYGGTIVGLGGSTGNSTGPHLHFEMRYNGAPQDPTGVVR